MGVVLPSEGDALPVKCKESMVGDSDSVRVSAQIAEDLSRTAECRFSVDDPVIAVQPPHVVLSESSKVLWKAEKYTGRVSGLSGARDDGEFVTFDVSSGSYAFQLAAGALRQRAKPRE